MQLQQPQQFNNTFSPQQYTINQTHNLIVQNIVKNQQITHIVYFPKLQHIKILYRQGKQYKFITGLVIAGRSFIKLYAIFENYIIEELNSSKIYEDITNIHIWDKVIVLETKHKIIGLLYQQSIFKNAFMLSLQFLPLSPNDQCKCIFDKNGMIFVVQIKNYLLLCMSSTYIMKFKNKPIYKINTEIVTQDVKWNRVSGMEQQLISQGNQQNYTHSNVNINNNNNKVYIEQIIKIRLVDFQINHAYNLNICQQSLYFIGVKNYQKPNQHNEFYQKAFYFINFQQFFIQNTSSTNLPVCQYLAKKDPEVNTMIPYISSNKLIQCLFCKKDSIYIQIQRDMVLVDQYQNGGYQILHMNLGDVFVLWVKNDSNLINLYIRVGGNKFIKKSITFNFYFNNFLVKQLPFNSEGIIVYNSQIEIGLIKFDLSFIKREIQNHNTNNNQSNNLIEQELSLSSKDIKPFNKHFANIVDFQIGKNIFILQSRFIQSPVISNNNNENTNYQVNQHQIRSVVYQLKRMLNTDPKPYITHSKKNFLQEEMGKYNFVTIKSMKFRLRSMDSQNVNISQLFSDNLIIAEISHNKTLQFNNKFIIYRQIQHQPTALSKEININKKDSNNNLLFQKIFQDIIFYDRSIYQSNQYLIFVNHKNQIWVQEQIKEIGADYEVNNNLVKKTILQFGQEKDQYLETCSCIAKYFIYRINSTNKLQLTFRFFDIFTHNHFDVDIPITITNQNILKIFFHKKSDSFKKKDQLKTITQIFIIYQNSLQIYQIQTQSKHLKLTLSCSSISKGFPFLLNTQNNPQIINKSKLRSHTCPQYILSEYYSGKKDNNFVKNAYFYEYQNIVLLIFVNNQKQLIVYKRHLSFTNQTGYVYKRVVLPVTVVAGFKFVEGEKMIEMIGQGVLKIYNLILCKGQFLQHNLNHVSYFQIDMVLWTIQREKIKMVDLKPTGGSNQMLFKQSYRKDSKDFVNNLDTIPTYKNTLADVINIMSNFIVTPIKTLMRKQLMGIQISGDYFILYSKTGFQILNQKDFKPVWICNLSTQNPQRKQVIINVKAYDHYIAVSYYDYILDQNTQFKSIKFKFRIYNILSKTKILQKSKATQQPILHIRPISFDKILLATSSTLYIYQIKAQKSLEPLRTRNFSKRFSLNSFSYIPQQFDEKTKITRPCYMLMANTFGGISFHVGKWIDNQNLRQQWFDNIRCRIRNLQLFHYGEELKALITDDDCNLIVINLKANKADKIADLNVGSKANVLRCRHQHDSKIYGCFQDGTIKCISAVKLQNPQISFLSFQQEAFCKQIPLLGGFNLRISRLLSQKYRTYKYVSRGNMLDCDLLEDFFSLTTTLKDQICQKSQLKIEQLKGIIRSI